MFAVYASAPNADDPLAALEAGERPEPDVPDGWVEVEVRAASLNMHDVFTLRGVGIREEAFPMILGCDGAGVLEDGSEVVIHGVVASPGWMGDETLDPGRTLLSEKHPGTFAERVAVPAPNALPKPPELSFAEAACMGTAWLTAYRMLFVKSGLRPGQTMLVQGASGGVSTALIMLGSAAGQRVWVQRLFFLQLRVLGSTMGTRDELEDLLALCVQRDIRPLIGAEMALSSARDGVDAMLAGETAGKVVFSR